MKILLVSTTAIGDSVMATPLIRAVRQRYPDADITLFAHVRRMAVFENNPHLNRILVYHGKWKKLVRILLALRQAHFDLAIVLHANDPDIVPLVRWTGAPIRVGWGESKWAKLFTHTILRTKPPEHFLIHKKRLLETVQIPVADLHSEIFLQPKDESAFQNRLLPWIQRTSPDGRFVTMHAFGTNPKKWWPLDGFFAIADQTFQQYRLPTVFVGDGEALSLVKKHPKFHADRHAIAQDFDIRESAVVIQKSIAMLTTDSGPMHLAFAVRCPTLTLFGATQPSIYGPCVDLDQHRVIHRDPLDKLTVEEVWDAWNGKLKIENDPE